MPQTPIAPIAAATYFVRVNAGRVTGSGYSSDGTLPSDGLACSQTAAQSSGPWSTVADGVLTVGAPPPPSLSQQAIAIVAAGLTVSSTSTPALNAQYACDTESTVHIQAELLSLITSKTFTDGTDTIAWPDVAGNVHVFPNGAVFTAFAVAVGAFVAAGYKVANGTSQTLPAPSVTIA